MYVNAKGNSMKLELVRGTCTNNITCPALYRTDRATAVVRGWSVTDPTTLHRLGLPARESAVEVPAELVSEVLHRWPAVHRTDRGTLLVPGMTVTDAEALRQMRLPAGEHAVEVPAELLTGVLQAC
jgi:hypothetical protein